MSGVSDLVALASLFVRESFVAFGGGVAILPEIERVAVTQHHWLTAQQFGDCYALGQLTPGPGMLMVMAIGYKVAGVPGALISMLAMFVPVAALSYVVGVRWHALRGSSWRIAIGRGLTPVTIGLLTAGTYTLTRASVTDLGGAAIATVAGLLLLSRRVSPALIVLGGGLAGVALYH
jgi:chromate transporter